MSEVLTPQQLAYLSSEFTQMAETLKAFQQTVAADPNVDLTEIQSQVGSLLDISNNLANRAIATAFDDSAQGYANLRTITENANKMAASLAQEATKASKLVGIAARMIDLATALGSGKVLSVAEAVAALAKAVHS